MEVTIPSTTEDTDSPSSLVAEPSMSDSPDILLPNENEDADKKAEEERKLRRLERRKALALERSPMPPKLGGVLKSANNTIDLTTEDDDPTNQWFKKTFNIDKVDKKMKSPEEAKLFAVPRHVAKNAPRSIIYKEAMDKKLKASLAVKRRKAQEERRKMYEEDNEHLKEDTDEEEEEEVVIKKKKAKKPENEESDSDDEDYKPPGEEDHDDEMSVNLLNDSFTYDVFNNAKRSGPGSIVSNYSRSHDDLTDKNLLPTMSQLMGGGIVSNGGSEDILDFCSGKFEEFPDTLQMLLNEEKEKKGVNVPTTIENTRKPSPHPASEDEEGDADDDEDEEVGPAKKKVLTKKANRILDSDEEEDDEEVEETQQKSQDVFGSLEDAVEEVVTEEITTTTLTRVVVSGDESEEEEEAVGEEEEEEEDPEEEAPEEEEEEDNAPEPNFDDEDDELAVLKRIEHQEYKKQIKKRTLFDDEASLSGDDVGSDIEDEEGVENAYEAEEGDADDVPDDDTIRRQNFKMLLKQENDKETRALAKLQEQLLADGDLGGVETNRQFRFKLREEVETVIGMNIDGVEEVSEDDEPEEDVEKKKERAEMIKYRIEHAEELELLDQTHDNDDDDMFARAGKLLKKTEKITIEASEEISIKSKPSVKPSLLSKSALAVSFQEVLNGNNGAAPKQMYVQNYNSGGAGGGATSSGSKNPSRLSSGVKRALTSPDASEKAKRVRSSKLSSLE